MTIHGRSVAHNGGLLASLLTGFIATGAFAHAATGAAHVQTVSIPMRDGQQLAADYYPSTSREKQPTILIMTPYNRLQFRKRLQPGKDLFYDPEHYHYVIVDWRGFYASKSTAPNTRKLFPGQLGMDGYDCVEWIARQPWSNGRIGTWGPSALGRVQFQTAAEHPPHLICIVPVVAKFGQSYGQYYQGGVVKKGYLDALHKVGFTPVTEMIYAHPEQDAFWRWVQRQSEPSMIQVPVFMIGGWYDLFTDGVLETFQDIVKLGGEQTRLHSKLLIGPWHHTAMGHRKQTELEFPEAENVPQKEALRFLDYWLRGRKDNGWDQEAPLRYFQMGENTWETATSWPPDNLGAKAWYLHPDGSLRPDRPANHSFGSFQYDPGDPSPTIGGMNLSLFELSAAAPHIQALLQNTLRAGPMDQRRRVESRNDHVIFTTPPLEETMAIRGNVQTRLYVSTNCEDTDIAVRLCDVYPDGRSMLVTDGIGRLQYRNGKASPVTPGVIYPIAIHLPVTAVSFLQGHRIRVILTSSNYPRFDRNPNNGFHRLEDGPHSRIANNRIHYGPAYPSSVTFPVVQK